MRVMAVWSMEAAVGSRTRDRGWDPRATRVTCQAPPGQGVRGLQAHGARAHHHDLAGWRQAGFQALPVGQGAQGVNAGEVLAP